MVQVAEKLIAELHDINAGGYTWAQFHDLASFFTANLDESK